MIEQSNKPVVSVMTVTYNHGDFIRQCLESIMMQQTNFPFEVIVGEDCSTDSTRSIVQEFAERHSNIKPIYHQKNVGAARNACEFCLPLLTGKYVAICEGDDFWTDPLKLQKQVDFLESNPSIAFCFHNHNVVNESGEVVLKRQETPLKIYSNKEIFHLRLQPLTVMFRNSLRIEPEELIKMKGSDVLLFYILSRNGGAANLGFVGGSYRQHASGLYGRMKPIQQHISIIKGLREFTTYSIFNVEEKKQINREIALRKKIFMMRYLKDFKLGRCVEVLLA